MKIDDKTLSIPPFISTSWKNITAIHTKGGVLMISLVNGENIEIPHLKPDVIELIFNYHALYIEKESIQQNPSSQPFSNKKSPFFQQAGSGGTEGTFKFDLSGAGIESLGAAMHHNPAYANAPNLPDEILNKVATLAKLMSPDEVAAIPKAEPHCNCLYCQIVRALTHEQAVSKEESHDHHANEEVSEEELQFTEWDITLTGDNLYTVVSRLDPEEKYSVYLGNPVGCTCGKEGCEHILAVLKS